MLTETDKIDIVLAEARVAYKNHIIKKSDCIKASFFYRFDIILRKEIFSVNQNE